MVFNVPIFTKLTTNFWTPTVMNFIHIGQKNAENRYELSFMPLSMGFSMQFLTKLTNDQRLYVAISYTEFHPYGSRNMENVGSNYFTPLSTV
jgi:hypothetical protein